MRHLIPGQKTWIADFDRIVLGRVEVANKRAFTEPDFQRSLAGQTGKQLREQSSDRGCGARPFAKRELRLMKEMVARSHWKSENRRNIIFFQKEIFILLRIQIPRR